MLLSFSNGNFRFRGANFEGANIVLPALYSLPYCCRLNKSFLARSSGQGHDDLASLFNSFFFPLCFVEQNGAEIFHLNFDSIVLIVSTIKRVSVRAVRSILLETQISLISCVL